MAYGIQQVTNFSNIMQTAASAYHQVLIGNTKYENKEYKILTATNLIGNPIPIVKLGYVCEPKGKDYPIYLISNGDEKEFYLGKTGMFEIQPETFLDINGDEDEEIITVIPKITAIQVPVDIQFKLDFVYTIN